MDYHKKIEGDIFKPTYASQELPTKKKFYNVVLKTESGKGIKRQKHFDPTDEKSIEEFKRDVHTWNKLIKKGV